MDESTVTQEGFATLEDFNENVKQNEQMALFDLQELAVNTTRSIQTIQEQLKTATEMYNEAFTNNASYHQENERIKEISKVLKDMKVQIERQPSVIALAQKVKELRNELKEKKASVSDYVLEVYRITGNNEFEKDGEVFEIKTVAKLVKKKQ